MKKSVKRLIAVLGCLTMTMTSISPAFAANVNDESYANLKAEITAAKAEGDPYADLKLSIYEQLEAQNALQHYDLQVAALIPQEGAPVSRSTSRTWSAPNGGILGYSYDYTYRDESGYVDARIVYMDKQTTLEYLAGQFGTMQDITNAIVGFPLGLTVLGPYIASIAIFDGVVDYVTKQNINAAGGYAQISATYDSISGTKSKVLWGWDTYSSVTLDTSNKYNVSFNYG